MMLIFTGFLICLFLWSTLFSFLLGHGHAFGDGTKLSVKSLLESVDRLRRVSNWVWCVSSVESRKAETLGSAQSRQCHEESLSLKKNSHLMPKHLRWYQQSQVSHATLSNLLALWHCPQGHFMFGPGFCCISPAIIKRRLINIRDFCLWIFFLWISFYGLRSISNPFQIGSSSVFGVYSQHMPSPFHLRLTSNYTSQPFPQLQSKPYLCQNFWCSRGCQFGWLQIGVVNNQWCFNISTVNNRWFIQIFVFFSK